MRTTIHLLRHGEVHNPQRVLYGRLPGFGLSALGLRMTVASALALRKQNTDLALITASPLLRAQQSATAASFLFDLPVGADSRLVEAANSFEGATASQIRATAFSPSQWDRFANPLKPSWGEPYSRVLQRMRSVVAETLEAARGREALLVSHQLPIWTLRSALEGWPLAHLPFQRECSLASLTSLVFDDYTLTGLYYWEPAAHLLAEAADLVPGQSAAHLLK